LFESAISKPDIDNTNRTLFEAGGSAGQNLADGLNGKKPLVLQKGKELLGSVHTDEGSVSLKSAMYQAGSEGGQKLADGLSDKGAVVRESSKKLVNSAIADPSDTRAQASMYQTGAAIGQNLADGMNSKKPVISNSASDTVGSMVSGVQTALNGTTVNSAIANAMSSISSVIMTTFDNDMRNTGATKAKEIGESIGKAYAGGVGSTATSGVQSIISNGLSKIGETLKDLTTIEVGGVKPFSFATSILTKFNVPLLAKGAVIPPNAPFAAILGDQKKGTNIEAPLDTIKQAVRDVLGDGRQMGGNTYNVTATAKGRALFDLIITEGHDELVRTGKNPFELVKS
jgi:hypothetical protein